MYFQIVFVCFLFICFLFLPNCFIVVSNLAKLHFRALPVGIYNLLTRTAFPACFTNPLGYFFVGCPSDTLILNSNRIDTLEKKMNLQCRRKHITQFNCIAHKSFFRESYLLITFNIFYLQILCLEIHHCTSSDRTTHRIPKTETEMKRRGEDIPLNHDLMHQVTIKL